MNSRFAMSLNIIYLQDDFCYSFIRHTHQQNGRLSFGRQNSVGL